jgi:hypothetical protein
MKQQWGLKQEKHVPKYTSMRKATDAERSDMASYSMTASGRTSTIILFALILDYMKMQNCWTMRFSQQAILFPGMSLHMNPNDVYLCVSHSSLELGVLYLSIQIHMYQ